MDYHLATPALAELARTSGQRPAPRTLGRYVLEEKVGAEAKKLYGDVSLPVLEKLARSRLNDVRMDPKYRTTQDAALDKLMGIANEGGMDAHRHFAVLLLNHRQQFDAITKTHRILHINGRERADSLY